MRIAFRIVGVVLALISAFFVFYTVRLLVVTRGLQAIRADGQGAFIGAVAFPLLALTFGWAGYRAWRRAARQDPPVGRSN